MNFDIHHFADIVVWVKFGFGINACPEKKRKKHIEKREKKKRKAEVEPRTKKKQKNKKK